MMERNESIETGLKTLTGVDWQVIVELASSQNVTVTSRKMIMTQPAVSQKLQHIERKLGVLLFKRSRNGLTLTQAGEFVLRFATLHLQRLDEFKQQLANVGNLEAGTLRIAMTGVMTGCYMPHILAKFQKRYPGIRVDVLLESSADILHMVKNGTVSFGFCERTTDFTEAECIQLTNYRMVVACKQEFELLELPLLSRVEYHYEDVQQNQLGRWWQEHFQAPPLIATGVPSLYAALAMLEQDAGYAFLPDILVLQSPFKLFSRPLVFDDGQPFTCDTYAIYNQKTLENNLAHCFATFLREHGRHLTA